jgi:hypothetical protein
LFNVFNGVRWFYIKCDGLTSQSFHENLHGEVESFFVCSFT